MLHRHTLERGTRWITLLALLFATLAPSVAHALRHARGEVMPWSQLCSATGGKRIVFEQSADGGSPLQPGHAFEHCVYCALHHDASLPGDAAAPLRLRADLSHAVDGAARSIPLAPLPWHAAPARAPPRST
jgi:hypothetical protein